MMAWVGMVDGKGSQVRWMVDEADRPVSVNGDRYLAMIRNCVWPEVRYRSSRRHFWWQQDGASAHCTAAVPSFKVRRPRHGGIKDLDFQPNFILAQ